MIDSDRARQSSIHSIYDNGFMGVHLPMSDFVLLEEGGLELWQLVTVALTSKKFLMSP